MPTAARSPDPGRAPAGGCRDPRCGGKAHGRRTHIPRSEDRADPDRARGLPRSTTKAGSPWLPIRCCPPRLRRPSACSSSWPKATCALVPMPSRRCIRSRRGCRAGADVVGQRQRHDRLCASPRGDRAGLLRLAPDRARRSAKPGPGVPSTSRTVMSRRYDRNCTGMRAGPQARAPVASAGASAPCVARGGRTRSEA